MLISLKPIKDCTLQIPGLFINKNEYNLFELRARRENGLLPGVYRVTLTVRNTIPQIDNIYHILWTTGVTTNYVIQYLNRIVTFVHIKLVLPF